jgi:hypothetical protein
MAAADCLNLPECVRRDPLAAFACGEVWGQLCEETPPAGADRDLADSTGTVAHPHQGRGNHAGPDERPPSKSVLANPVAPPYSPRHDWHDCPSPFPACGVSREDAMTPLQRADCRECHQGFGHD